MQSLKLFLGLKIRSKVNWVQNNKTIDETLISMPPHVYFITSIYFTEIIQNVFMILV